MPRLESSQNEELKILAISDIGKFLTPSYWLVVVFANSVGWLAEEAFADAVTSSEVYRISVCVLTLPLFVPRFRRLFTDRLASQYLIFFLILQCPLLFGFLTLSNPASQTGSTYWLFQFFVGTFVFFPLFRDQRLPLAISTLCVITLFSALSFIDVQRDVGTALAMITSVLTTFVFASLTHQRMSFVSSHKLRAASAVGRRIAHELRTPLMTIRNAALQIQVAERDRADSSELKRIAAMITSEVAFSNALIDNVLAITKPGPYEIGLKDRCSAIDAIELAVARFPYRNSKERASTHALGGKDFAIPASQTLICHVLFNLISNALDAATDYETMDIRLAADTGGGRKTITVYDTGPGVSTKEAGRIFDEFYSTKGDSGTGIGLAFCRSVLRQIGGDIHYRRDHGITQFTLSF